MLTEKRTEALQLPMDEDYVSYRLTQTKDGFLVKVKSAMIEKKIQELFPKVGSSYTYNRKGTQLQVKVYQARLNFPTGQISYVDTLAWTAKPIFLPLCMVGLSEGVEVLIPGPSSPRQRKQLEEQLVQILKDFYSAYIQEYDVEVTLSVRRRPE